MEESYALQAEREMWEAIASVPRCKYCGGEDLYKTPTLAVLCGYCGRKQDTATPLWQS